jgi:DNA-binding GntR family transcriptional regulator
MSEAAYRQIRDEILSGQLKASMKLRAEELAPRYGVSAGPLREALSRLAGEGLVVGEGQRGHWVAPMSVKEFKEITELRLQLEVQALRSSIALADIDWESRVVASFHRLSRVEGMIDKHHKSIAAEFERENREFHWALISCCPSEWILRLTSILYDHSERYRQQAVAARPIPAKIVQAEHKLIMDASLARDADRASIALSQHILNTARNVETLLAGQELK